MTTLSDDELAKLVLRRDEDNANYATLIRLRESIGPVACVRRMLALFERRESPDLCEKSWNAALTICLTDEQPEMNLESSRLWTDAILEAMKDDSPEIRARAAGALGFGLSGEQFTPSINSALMTGLADASVEVRFESGQTLQQSGRQAIPYLTTALLDERYQRPHANPNDRCSSVWDILFTLDGILGRQDTTPGDRDASACAVGGFLETRFPDDGLDCMDVWKAGDTLGEHIGGREALATLSALIDHPDPRVRASVAHGLSHLKEPEARERLHLLLHDGDEGVRNEAAKYLNRPPGSG